MVKIEVGICILRLRSKVYNKLNKDQMVSSTKSFILEWLNQSNHQELKTRFKIFSKMSVCPFKKIDPNDGFFKLSNSVLSRISLSACI